MTNYSLMSSLADEEGVWKNICITRIRMRKKHAKKKTWIYIKNFNLLCEGKHPIILLAFKMLTKNYVTCLIPKWHDRTATTTTATMIYDTSLYIFKLPLYIAYYCCNYI